MSDFKDLSMQAKWYALRDLKRPNAKLPGYKLLEEELRMRVFIPKKEKLLMKNGKKVKMEVPVIPDLLFVHDTLENVRHIVEKTETLQFRYKRGGRQHEPIVVPDYDMERFIHAVEVSGKAKYYLPEDLTSQMCGRRIRVVGGPMDGSEGTLLTIRGSKTRRLLVELPGFFSVGVEVNPEYIHLLE
ncbi:MAG: UpxY family transcription antiterminator [Bacteroidaceae bacterium]|nr:UpxY family transcription antiterminator [Bacteroidaceae bacterium]